MIEALLLIFLCQLVGEALARLVSLPVPGPVIGMALLFASLQFRGMRDAAASPIGGTALGTVAAFILANLSLLFVPAGVGIVGHLPTLAAHGIGLIAALLVSTTLSLAVTALVFAALSRRSERGAGP